MALKGTAWLDSAAQQAGLAWLRARRRWDRPDLDRVLLMPPAADAGSIGDEAMINAVAGALRTDDGEPGADLLVPDGQGPRPNVRAVGRQVDGFNLLVPLDKAERRRLHGIMGRYGACYFFGADVMDGRYNLLQTLRTLRLLRESARLGLDTRLLGFSWSGDALAPVVAAFRKLPRRVKIYVRDPISLERFRKETGVKAALAADVAFLLEPEKNPQRAAAAKAWADRERADGRILLGINLSGHAFGLHDDETTARVAGQVAEALTEVSKTHPNLSVLAIPHDRRDIPGAGSDVRAAEELVRRLQPAFGAHAAVLPADVTAMEIKALAGGMDLVLTSRMHLAIAALGSGVPIACIPYMGKFEGLLEHFDLEGLTIEPDRAVVPGELASFLAALLHRRDALRKQVEQRLPAVQTAARLNLRKEAP